MRHTRLGDLPPVVLPEGYCFRTFRPGDAETWANIVNAAFGSSGQTAQKYEETFVRNELFSPDRQFFLMCGDETVGVVCAWEKQEGEEVVGYVHYVALLPGHRGKGLGIALTLKALHKISESGFKEAILDTDDHHIPAIRAYLRAGFEPVIRDEDDRRRWAAVMEKIG